MPHYFYLARCNDGSLYAGTCIDPVDRERTHNEGRGAKYTRSRLPVHFLHLERFRTLSAARKREIEVKRWKKSEKELLVKAKPTNEKPRKPKQR